VAKKVRERLLDSPTARAKLKISGKPYYRSIGPELHLGYRKGKDARRWVVRLYLGDGQYRVENIGHADDIADADGVSVLDFWQAQEKARALQQRRMVVSAKRYTVGMAIKDYLDHLDGRPAKEKTRLRLAAYVPRELADKELGDLTAPDLSAWLRGMIKMPPRARTAEGAKRNYRKVDMGDPEVIRQRKASANRVMNQLRAALNLAFKNGKVHSDNAWRRVSAFKETDAARIRYLTVAECQRLNNACDPEFRILVMAALQTGARYQELARLTVEDFNPDSGTLHIRKSKSGKQRHIVLTEEGIELFQGLAVGRKGSDLLLGREWRDTAQVPRMALACERGKIDPPITFHGLRHTWASLSVMGGMPLMVVAKNLGHVSTRMVEKHYGHLAPSYIADAIRQHAPRFGKVESNVKAIR
jgi:integrase